MPSQGVSGERVHSLFKTEDSSIFVGNPNPQLVEAAAVLDGFENSYLSEGEWMKRNYTILGNTINSINQNLGTLARVDMEGASSLAGQLERPEIRFMAQLEIAQNLLNNSRIVRPSNFTRMDQIIRHYPRH